MSDLSQRLELIGSIEAGYTINIKKRRLVYHDSWFTAISRWKSEDRLSTIRYIEETIAQAITALSSEMGILMLLKHARKGIDGLKETYASDEEICQRLDACNARIENVCVRFEHMIISSIEQIPKLIEIMTTTVDAHEFDGLHLVKQTPITSPYGSTPFRTPQEQTPRVQTPSVQTPPKTPPSTPKHPRSPALTPPKTPPSTPKHSHSPSQSPPKVDAVNTMNLIDIDIPKMPKIPLINRRSRFYGSPIPSSLLEPHFPRYNFNLTNSTLHNVFTSYQRNRKESSVNVIPKMEPID